MILPFVFWLVMSRSVFGYQIRVVGSAPNAARHGGFDSKQTIWLAMLIGGGMAGLAGALEFTGRAEGHQSRLSIGLWLYRDHRRRSSGGCIRSACLIAGIVLAVTYVGGQVAQTTVHIPNATAGIFQAMMLFFILASDILVRYRVRIISARQAPALAAEK